ncbi:MAG TPA: hypothetical protein PKL14_06625 [Holophaga sp.]|jgi:hypothetical protein|nr:hypothetical protein [Holophaga sp.]
MQRRLSTLMAPALILLTACGTSRLSRREAEKDIRQDYPVIVPIRVPARTAVAAGSPEAAKLIAAQDLLRKTGWFAAEHHTEGAQEVFTFNALPSASNVVRTSAKGWEIPAAEAGFVRATRLEANGDSARVTYLVRLQKPTAQFGLFQSLHPGVRIGETKERHAAYRREGRSWILQDTDEAFKKER